MSKLSKFLLSQGELIKECVTNSNYYLIKSKYVRISDHMGISSNTQDLNIYIPKNSKTQYIMVLNGTLYIYNSFTELKQFLLNWILIVDNIEYISEIKTSKMLDIARTGQSATHRELVKAQKEIKLLKNTIISQSKIKVDKYSLDLFSKGQKSQILQFIASLPKKTNVK